MNTYVSLDFIEEYLRDTCFLQNGVIPYIAVRDMIANAPKIDIEKIQARRVLSSDTPYVNDKEFEDYLYSSIVHDLTQEILTNHNNFIGKGESENVPFPMTKEYRVQMMIAKPHKTQFSRETIEMLNKEPKWRGEE